MEGGGRGGEKKPNKTNKKKEKPPKQKIKKTKQKKKHTDINYSPWWKSQYSYGKPKYLFSYSTLGAGCKKNKKNVSTSGTTSFFLNLNQ